MRESVSSSGDCDPPPPFYVHYQTSNDKRQILPAYYKADIHEDRRETDPLLPVAHKKRSANWCGILLAFLSGAFFTLSSAAVKALRSIDPMELLVLRSVVQVLAMLPIACRRGDHVLGPPGFRLLLQLQGLVGGVTLVLLFFSFRRLPLGDATTIIFSSPMFVMVLSFLFLREPCGFFRTTIVFLLLTGVILISKPPFIFQVLFHRGEDQHKQHYDLFGYACALSATVFTALNMVVMRKCKDVHFSVVVLQLSSWSLVVSTAVLLTMGTPAPPRGPVQWVLAVGVSALGLTGQVLVARALSMEGAGRVAVTRSLDIVLAFVLQVFVFREVPDWLGVMGASLVLLCVVAMGLEEHIQDLTRLLP